MSNESRYGLLDSFLHIGFQTPTHHVMESNIKLICFCFDRGEVIEPLRRNHGEGQFHTEIVEVFRPLVAKSHR